jgi:diguanylate cyclase (GGDEF)-like protein/PAS domain S-box-containing protein
VAIGTPKGANVQEQHPLLARQLRRLGLGEGQVPEPSLWPAVTARISAAYRDADQQRYLAERSLDVSLNELVGLNDDLTSARRRLEAVFDSASVGLCVMDGHGIIESVNPGAETALGVTEAEVIGNHLWQVVAIRAEPNGILLDRQNYHLTAKAAQPWQMEDATVTCGRHTFSANCVLTPLGTHGTEHAGAVLMIVDTTARKKAQADLAWRARYDALTGLANRDTVMHRITAELDSASTAPQTCALIFIDLDRFKSVNDTLGHAAGDELLTLAASRLSQSVRATDIVGRWAGDEFVVFCAPITRDEAFAIAQRVAEEIDRTFVIAGSEAHVTASVGIALNRTDSTASSLVAEADSAMYEAKDSGRGVIRTFDDNARNQTSRRLFLEQQLRAALTISAVDVAFQPQLDLATGALVGFELLSRWNLPDGSHVPPAEFIPIAEETGLIHDLGWNILHVAVHAGTNWADRPGLSLAVNLSSRQLQRPGFVDRLRHLLDERDLRPGNLTLEITESVLLSDPEGALAQLRRIRQLGVRLAIDDFGTGYSSLSYLRRLPVNDVKIDREFIADLTSSGPGRTIVDAVVRMSHALGYRVIAEGVETAEQADLLMNLGCDIGQGWLFGHPTTLSDAQTLLSAGRVRPVAAPTGAARPR